MKCPKCNHTWALIGMTSSSISNCPKCKDEITISPDSFDNVQDALIYLFLTYGNKPYSIMKDKTKLTIHLKDMLGSNYSERDLIELAIKCDVCEILYDGINQNRSQQQRVCKKAIETLSQSAYLKPEKASQIVHLFSSALGGNETIAMPPLPLPLPPHLGIIDLLRRCNIYYIWYSTVCRN